MNIFLTVAPKVIIGLGILNLVAALLIVSSCRCMATWNLTKGLMKCGRYKHFLKLHCYIWWIFWPSVTTHAIIGIVFFQKYV